MRKDESISAVPLLPCAEDLSHVIIDESRAYAKRASVHARGHGGGDAGEAGPASGPAIAGGKRKRARNATSGGTVRAPPKEHGNYGSYYGYRLLENGEDPRLAFLKNEWVSGKRVLDIGCNSGVLTLKLLDPEFRARSVLGVDIDPELIRKARRRCRGKPTKTASFVVADAASPTFAAGGIGASSANDGKEAPSVTVPSMKFGLVLCLSVTKWIHLHHGDEGIMRLFRNVTSVLEEGGIFVLEPQPLTSYRKAIHKNKTMENLKRNFENMKLSPDSFAGCLEEMGMELIASNNPERAAKGFNRPILMFRKKAKL